ncbi:S1 family peptidase [Streptomyces sp. NPDC088554]|uniref:S1 family peptidase n=1 Tax=Streptomyces sp. NPDC088554 TaxID=3365865 RepID=UPI0038247DB7
MKHARRNLRRIVRLAAVGGLLCGGLMVSNAMADEPDGRAVGSGIARSAEVGADLVTRLGDTRTAGSWIADDGQPVVAVTDEEAAAEVRESGARAKVMRYSASDLGSATEALGKAPRVPGTSWAVDYRSNEVVVRVDSTVSAEDWSRLSEVAAGIGASVRMERTEGSFRTMLNGASPIFNGRGRCSVGFNVTNGQRDFILTAGHCGPVGTSWVQGGQVGQTGPQVGTTVAGNFPGNDYSLVEYENPDVVDGTNIVDIGEGQGVRVTGAADPVVGQQVFRSGSTTGLRSGRVTALNATVNYVEGAVTGLIQTTVCAEPGDSGGPLLSEGVALGVTSGGTGDCTSGGVTFFQPVTEALSALGVSLVDAPNAGAGTGTGTGNSTTQNPPPAAPPAAEVVTPGAAGQQQSVIGAVDYQALIPGLGIIAASLFLLMVAQRALSDRVGRNRYRNQYSQSWG